MSVRGLLLKSTDLSVGIAEREAGMVWRLLFERSRDVMAVQLRIEGGRKGRRSLVRVTLFLLESIASAIIFMLFR
jgi:hypothetical protein